MRCYDALFDNSCLFFSRNFTISQLGHLLNNPLSLGEDFGPRFSCTANQLKWFVNYAAQELVT